MKRKYNLAVRQYSGVCAVRVLPQREIRRGGSGRLFRGEHRIFDIRYVPRTHGEHLVRADGAGGTHDFETEINNAIDSFGPMLCVSIIIAIVLTIVAYMICKKKFAGFSVGGVKQALFILLAALSIMGCAMTLNNTFTRGVHNVNTVVIETDDDIRTAFYDGPHRIRVTPWKGAGVDAWIDLPKERCGKVEVGDSIEVKVETGLFGVRICSLTE